MNSYPHVETFESASVILPVIDEASSLRQTVGVILGDAGNRIRELLIVVCGKTTPEAMGAVGQLQKDLGDLVVVHNQRLPFLGGAIREAFALARGSHVILMASDLETDPNLVRVLIAGAEKNPSGIITASRWAGGMRFHGYSKIKLVCNWLFQRFFSAVYATRLSDMTYAYRIFPTKLVQAIRWEELRHPFLFETVVKPLRLGVRVTEVPATWHARTEGEPHNPFFRNFAYFRIGLKVRLARKDTLLLPAGRPPRTLMKKVIVTTTINPPTEAIRRFQAMEDWELVVIGDRKTPRDYRLERGIYVTPEEQEKYDPPLSDAIGWNCIQRRSFGLLWAHDLGADVVAVVDDDNIPYAGWGRNLLVGRDAEVNFYETGLPAFDPVGATNHGHLWHRGFPLQLVSRRHYDRRSRRTVRVDIQADFWNGDPDIDAICRMVHSPECDFDPGAFPIASDKMSPFNSQNTFFSGKMLKDYFLFPHVGRMDDIWAAYHVQARGYRAVYDKPSVYQKRNTHDIIQDMRQEYIGYEHNLQLVEDLARNAESLLKYLPPRSASAFKLYQKHFSHA